MEIARAVIGRAYRNAWVAKGRSGKSDYVIFTLFVLFGTLGLFALERAIFGDLFYGSAPASSLFLVLSMPAQLSLFVRRLHDTDETAWRHLPALLTGLIAFGFAYAYDLAPLPILGLIAVPLSQILSLPTLMEEGRDLGNRFGLDPTIPPRLRPLAAIHLESEPQNQLYRVRDHRHSSRF